MVSITNGYKMVKELWDIVNKAKEGGENIKDIIEYFRCKINGSNNAVIDAIRFRTKKAYQFYSISAKSKGLGIPLEKDILPYWELCLHRNVLPNVNDMMRHGCDAQEAEYMLQCLIHEWMKVPEFIDWQLELSNNKILEKQSYEIGMLREKIETQSHSLYDSISKLPKELMQQQIMSDMVFPITWERVKNERKKFNPTLERTYYNVNGYYRQILPVICTNNDIPHEGSMECCMESIFSDSVQPIIITGNGGQGKTSLMLKVAVTSAEAGIRVLYMDLSGGQTITRQVANQFFEMLMDDIPTEEKLLLCIDNPFDSISAFGILSQTWPIGNDNIQLILAERFNRILDRQFIAYLQNWFDNALMISLCNKISPKYFDGFEIYYFDNKYSRLQKILSHSLTLDNPNAPIEVIVEVVDETLKRFGSNWRVSLAELIYWGKFGLAQKLKNQLNLKSLLYAH